MDTKTYKVRKAILEVVFRAQVRGWLSAKNMVRIVKVLGMYE